jgi:drug/metabolite transporter (DMT)-like permease
VAVLLGLLVAISFGSGDFLGGRASQHANTVAVLFVAQCVAVVVAVIVAALVGADVSSSDLAYGAAAGVGTVTGLGLLYHGLAHGRISVVAPLTAVVGAIVPIGWALARGERPATVVLVGAACAVIAGALIAREREPADAAGRIGTGAGYALGAGVLLGSSLVLYAETSDASGFWPVLAARATALIVVGVAFAVLAVRSQVALPAGASRSLAFGAGLLDVGATALLVVAVRHGLLAVVAPVVALAPAFTVLWAWIVLRESIARSQLFGLGLALVGLVLVASG